MDSDHLSMVGNCIIAGLWRIMLDLRETIVAVLQLSCQSSKMRNGVARRCTLLAFEFGSEAHLCCAPCELRSSVV